MLKKIEQIANLSGLFPYRRFLNQHKEVLPMLDDEANGKINIGTALAQADARASRSSTSRQSKHFSDTGSARLK